MRAETALKTVSLFNIVYETLTLGRAVVVTTAAVAAARVCGQLELLYDTRKQQVKLHLFLVRSVFRLSGISRCVLMSLPACVWSAAAAAAVSGPAA